MKNIILIGDSIRLGYQGRVAELLGDGVQIFAPGEIELGRKADRMQNGIELAQNTYDFLVRKAQEYGIKEQI